VDFDWTDQSLFTALAETGFELLTWAQHFIYRRRESKTGRNPSKHTCTTIGYSAPVNPLPGGCAHERTDPNLLWTRTREVDERNNGSAKL